MLKMKNKINNIIWYLQLRGQPVATTTDNRIIGLLTDGSIFVKNIVFENLQKPKYERR